MNLRRSSLRGVAASAAALALIVGSGATGAWAQEESPAPEPEAITTSEAPINPLPEPKTARYHAGQSLQIRVNADAGQNSDLINYRWSVNQVTVNATSDENGQTLVVPMPDRGKLIRYLNSFGHPTVENGVAQLDTPVENNVGLSRTVSLWPQDEDPKVSLKAEFWLDGVKQESAQDVVGKDGVLTAQYTVSNLSNATYTVTVPDLDGNPVEVQQDAQQLYVGIAKTLLPQRYSGLNTPGGMGGADGRGNNQIQWIIVPTMPLNENGVKTFGWSAHVTDAVIPSILLQVQPVYHAPGHAEGEEESTPAEDAASAGIPLDPALAEISAGLDLVVQGLDQFAAFKGEPSTCEINGVTSTDPLACISNNINQLAGRVAELLVTGGPKLDTAIATAQEWQAKVQGWIASIGSLTPDNITDIQAIGAAMLADNLPSALAGGPDGKSDACNAYATAEDETFTQSLYDNCVTVATGLSTFSAGSSASTLNDLTDILASLESKLVKGKETLTSVSNIEANASVEAILAEAQATFLNNGGSLVVSGLDQVSAGIGQAKSIVAAYLSEAAAEIQAAAAAGKAELNTAVVHLRAEIAGLKAAMATSPFPYGGDASNLPEGTVLAGAYEFRIDAADTNHPYTLPRILIGLIALIAGGFAAKALAGRKDNNGGPSAVDDTYTVTT